MSDNLSKTVYEILNRYFRSNTIKPGIIDNAG